MYIYRTNLSTKYRMDLAQIDFYWEPGEKLNNEIRIDTLKRIVQHTHTEYLLEDWQHRKYTFSDAKNTAKKF